MRQACAIDHKMTIAPNQAHVKSIFGFYMDCVKYTRFTTIKWMVNVCFIFFRFYYFIPFCTTHDTIIASFTTHIMIIPTFLTLNPSNPFELHLWLFLSKGVFLLFHSFLHNPWYEYCLLYNPHYHIMIIQTFLSINPLNPFKLLFLSTFLFALPNPFFSYFMNTN